MGERNRLMTRSALFAALLCLLAPLAVPLGPVPVTLAGFAVILCGMVLEKKQAVAAVCIYILAGALGLPVFSGGRGGVAVLLGPTGGYIWAYPLVAGLAARLRQHLDASRRAGMFTLSAACALSLLPCHLLGTLWYMLLTHTPAPRAIAVCLLPFLPFDLFKAVAAAWLGTALRRRLELLQ